MSDDSCLLSVRGLAKQFGAVTAADNLTFEIAPGERVSLIGSNGAGKTTFVNMVTGYLKPDRGSILLNGENLAGLGPRQVARMGVSRSFQIPQLCIELSVLENMLVSLACAGDTPSPWASAYQPDHVMAAMSSLERFGLASQARRPARELPGGQRKLLDIALALIRSPRLLLLDEPTSGVSAQEKFPMMETIMAALAGQGVTILFVEHDMEIVNHYAQRVMAFYAGRVIVDAAPELALANEEVQRYVTGSLR